MAAGAPVAWGGLGGSVEWQLVHRNGVGGSAVKLSSCSAVGAKCGVWQASQPHSSSCVQVGQVFGGRGRSPTTEAVEVACAELAQSVTWWQVMQSAELRLSFTRKRPNWSSWGS